MLLNSLSGPTLTAGTKAADSQAKLQEDLNQFLTLLVTQLKNQDPLDPMDSNEFTSQLVQFASVEQQIYANGNLEELVGLQETNQISTMVDFIDKTIEASGQRFPLENGRGEFTYTMPANAKSAKILIRNDAGVTVYEQDAVLDQGEHSFVWNGKNRFGQTVADGSYLAVVTGLDKQNEILKISNTVYGRVTGIGIDQGVATLFMGDIEVPQSAVKSIKETPSVSN